MSDERFDWLALPFVLDITDVARVLRTSVTSIRRALSANAFPVMPMRRMGGKTAPFRWARADIQAYVEGGHRKVPGAPRRFFGKARGVA